MGFPKHSDTVLKLKLNCPNTQDVNNERCLISTRQNNEHIFGKATNGQTDIKHEMGKTLSSMSLFEDRRVCI